MLENGLPFFLLLSCISNEFCKVVGRKSKRSLSFKKLKSFFLSKKPSHSLEITSENCIWQKALKIRSSIIFICYFQSGFSLLSACFDEFFACHQVSISRNKVIKTHTLENKLHQVLLLLVLWLKCPFLFLQTHIMSNPWYVRPHFLRSSLSLSLMFSKGV